MSLFNKRKPLATEARSDPEAVTPDVSLPEAPVTGDRQKTILVVDDNPIILRTTSMKLKSQGFDVLTAIDGSEAIGAARRKRPDLILLDLSFPPDVAHGGGVGWDGLLIMSWLRRIDEARQIPIIVITGNQSDEVKKRALAAGASAFFTKPVEHADLLAAIERVLAGNPGGAANSPPPHQPRA
jgi:CheY-like chemotaxis protein